MSASAVGGFIIRHRVTGAVRMETQADLSAKLRPEWESVPVLQHLQEINRQGTLAYKAIRAEYEQWSGSHA
jgi:hypothetical protein